MRVLLTISLIVAAPLIWAADMSKLLPTSAAPAMKGEVLEVKEVESYTYLRLKTKDGETWAAVSKTPVKKGAQVTIDNPMVMKNFESKSLKKTFPSIVFGSLAGSAGAAQASPHGSASVAKADVADVKVPKATGANARTVAEIMTKSSELKDKSVVVRGKVVKFNPEIMGKNWVHLRDGTGSASDGSNDILVTTKNTAKVGDIVTVKGVVHTNKDLGSGYNYKVLVEEATLQP